MAFQEDRKIDTMKAGRDKKSQGTKKEKQAGHCYRTTVDLPAQQTAGHRDPNSGVLSEQELTPPCDWPPVGRRSPAPHPPSSDFPVLAWLLRLNSPFRATCLRHAARKFPICSLPRCDAGDVVRRVGALGAVSCSSRGVIDLQFSQHHYRATN